MNIKKLRKAAGMNIVELAYRMGVSTVSIRNWESGKHTPHVMFRAKLNQLLGKK